MTALLRILVLWRGRAVWLAAGVLFHAIGDFSLLPMQLTPGLLLLSAALTLTMCLLSSLVAMRRVLDADPAEVF